MDPLIEHVVHTRNPRMPQITLFLRPPKGISNASEVEGVLAVCVLANGLEDMKRELRKEEMTGDYAGLFSFANKHKLAILAWGSRGLWDPGRNYDDLSKEKAKAIDESFDLVSTAWARGVKELGDKYGIPQKNFLLWGNCGSAQFAARLCLRKPEYFLAIHVHMPGSYDKPTPEAAKVMWCLTIGELEGGYERSKRWVKAVREMGYPIVYKAIPGLGHAGHPDAAALGFEFFRFALLQKNKRDVLDADLAKRMHSESLGLTEPWVEEFKSPVCYGDMVNQEMYPLNQVDMIPKDFRIALPTKELAVIWEKDK
jgi:predicted esterase